MMENTKTEIVQKAYDLIGESKVKGFKYRDPITGAEIRYFKEYKTLYIFVDATNDLNDWITNVGGALSYKIIHINGFAVKIHKGYSLASYNLTNHLLIEKPEIFNNIEQIFVSGYSMGGGISPCMTLELYRNMPNFNYIGVGMEGTTYCRFPKKFELPENVKIINVINGNDTVTKVWFWFKKIGQIIHIGEKRKWWKIGIAKYNPIRTDKEGFLKQRFHIPDHHYGEFKKSLREWKKLNEQKRI